MDPYLEAPYWMTIQSQLLYEITGQLAPQLRPRYFPFAEKRFVKEVIDGVVSKVPHVTIEIRDIASQELATTIEVLTPTNKRGEGYEEYLGKRKRVLKTASHLLEIDLLRQGGRIPLSEPLPEAPYFVFLGRGAPFYLYLPHATNQPCTEIWPIGFQDPLPTVPVPLSLGDADVLLNLQLALTTLYDRMAYRWLVDYQRPPEVALPPEIVPWAEERVRDFLARS
jgi:hypothetical protein